MGNAHLSEYMKVTEGSVEEFILNQMTQIAWRLLLSIFHMAQKTHILLLLIC